MNRRAYSLVEVLVAAAVVALGLAGAAVMAHTMLLQQEANAANIRAANLQEQAAVLYRIGYGVTDITNIFPEPFVSSGTPGTNGYRLEFNTATNTVTGASALEVSNCRLVFQSARKSDGSVIFDTNDVVVARPSIR